MNTQTFAFKLPRFKKLVERFAPAEQEQAKLLLQDYLTFSILLSVLPTLPQEEHERCAQVCSSKDQRQFDTWLQQHSPPLRLLVEQTTARTLSALESTL